MPAATVLAILLPARVDSSEGEAQVGVLEFADPARRSRRRGTTPMVILALRCNAGLRILSGFLTMFMAFLLREHPFPGWEDKRTLLLALVIGSAGLGSTWAPSSDRSSRRASPRRSCCSRCCSTPRWRSMRRRSSACSPR